MINGADHIANRDIQTEDDIAALVNSFYKKVRQDELLAPVFEATIKGDWDQHLQRMCDFWSSLLLYSQKYRGDPMSKHMALNIGRKHFSRWLQLFVGTVDDLFDGENAKEAKKRAGYIAKLMQLTKNPSISDP